MPRGVVARRSIAWTAATLFFVTACGAGTAENPSPDNTAGEAGSITTPSPSGGAEVFFPEVRHEGGLDAVPTAMGGGELVLDGEGCLRMLYGKGPESGWVPVWTPYFEVDTGGGRVRIVDQRNGRTVGRVSEGISMSGGDISKQALRKNGILDERTWRELFERCPPGYSYWLVGGGVRIARTG